MAGLLNIANKLGFIEVDRADGRVDWLHVNAIAGIEEADKGCCLFVSGAWVMVKQSRTEIVRRIWQVLKPGKSFDAEPAPVAKEECPPTCLCTDCVREKTRPAGVASEEPAPKPLTLPWRVLLKSRAFGHPWATSDDAPPTHAQDHDSSDVWASGYNAALADLTLGKPLPGTGEVLRDIEKELQDTAQQAYDAGEAAGRQNAARCEAPKELDPGAITAIAIGHETHGEGPDQTALRLFMDNAGPLLFGWQQDNMSFRGALRALYVRGRADGMRAAPRTAPAIENLGPTAIGNPTDCMPIERARAKLVPHLRPNLNTLHPTITAALSQLFDDGVTLGKERAEELDTEEPRDWPAAGHPPFMGQVDINEALKAHVQNGVIKCSYARVVDATQAALRRVWEAGCDVADGKNDAAEREQYGQGKRAGWAMGWQAAWAAVRQLATHGLGKVPTMPADAQPVDHMAIEPPQPSAIGGDNGTTA